MKFVAISGSLRKASLNTALLREASKLTPEGVSMDIYTLEGIPLLEPDLLENGFPEAVNNLALAVKQADALVLASPEFNYSVTASMKNIIDWLSIHPDAPLRNKAVSMMSASPSGLGGARAQYHLRQMMIYPGAKVVNGPEVMIGNAFEHFTEEGKLTNDTSKDLIKQQLEALKALAAC